MNLKQWLRAQWDRVGAIGFVGLGLIVLLFGWIGMSGESLPAAQLPYIVSGGVLGIMLVGIGATGWLSADLRDEWRKLDDLEELLAQIVEPSGSVSIADEPAPGTPAAATREGPRALAGERRA